MSTSSIDLEAFHRDGFIVIDNVLPPALFQGAKEACEEAISRGRTGQWPHLRVVGKSFPPWPPSGPDIWGIQHLMHPDLALPIFKQIYTTPTLLQTATSILSLPDPTYLQLELFNLLINPTVTPFSLPYHRDTIPSSTSPEAELPLLSRPRTGTQYNLALYEDSCLIVVPGSHRRPKTAEEAELLTNDDKAELEREIKVHLSPNQAVFYENDILHRADYGTEMKRATLHGSVGIKGQVERARMVLQHGVGYLMDERFADDGFGDEEGVNVGKVMWKNLMDGYAWKRDGDERDQDGIHDS